MINFVRASLPRHQWTLNMIKFRRTFQVPVYRDIYLENIIQMHILCKFLVYEIEE